jgi:hypothetical protein
MIGAAFLIAESAGYIAQQGIAAPMSWAVAVALESGCVLLAGHRDWLSRGVLVALLLLALGASSLGRVNPIMAGDAADAGQRLKLSALDADIAATGEQIAFCARTKQPANHALHSRRLGEMQGERQTLLDAIAAAERPAIVWIHIVGIVAIRGVVQLINIICAGRLAAIARRVNSNQHPSIIEDYIERNGGAVTRQKLLTSRLMAGAESYDHELSRLVNAGVVAERRNGHKAGTIYALASSGR